MRKFIIFILISLFSFQFAVADTTDISFGLTIIKIEKAKDSYRFLETWSLEAGILHYQRRYIPGEGRVVPEPEVRKEKKLSKEEIKMINDLIIAKNVLQNIEPEKRKYEIPYTTMGVAWRYSGTHSGDRRKYEIILGDLSTVMEKNPMYADFVSLSVFLNSILK